MDTKNDLLIIADIDECVYRYSQRKSLAELALICTDIPDDDAVLANIKVAIVLQAERPDRIVVVQELDEYRRECGGLQRIIAVTSNSTLSREVVEMLATKVEEAGAEFAPQFI